MNCFCRRLGERFADVCDWIDYRPDANFRPFLVLPFLILLGWILGDMTSLALAFAFALLVSGVVATVGLLAISGWIVVHAVVDFAASARVPVAPKVAIRRVESPLA